MRLRTKWPIYALAAWIGLEILCLISAFSGSDARPDGFNPSEWMLLK